MNLHRLHLLKRWHVEHRLDHPVEYHLFDQILMVWVMGWTGIPAALILGRPDLLVVCALGFLVPGLYVACRTRLHHRGTLRCDWLHVLNPVAS